MGSLTKTCSVCRKTETREYPQEKLDRLGVEFVQNVFPELSDGDREWIITGTHGACFDSLFPPEEEEPF